MSLPGAHPDWEPGDIRCGACALGTPHVDEHGPCEGCDDPEDEERHEYWGCVHVRDHEVEVKVRGMRPCCCTRSPRRTESKEPGRAPYPADALRTPNPAALLEGP